MACELKGSIVDLTNRRCSFHAHQDRFWARNRLFFVPFFRSFLPPPPAVAEKGRVSCFKMHIDLCLMTDRVVSPDRICGLIGRIFSRDDENNWKQRSFCFFILSEWRTDCDRLFTFALFIVAESAAI